MRELFPLKARLYNFCCYFFCVSFGLLGMQLLEKYKENFDVSSEDQVSPMLSCFVGRFHDRK
jgi:hypothetical protein